MKFCAGATCQSSAFFPVKRTLEPNSALSMPRPQCCLWRNTIGFTPTLVEGSASVNIFTPVQHSTIFYNTIVSKFPLSVHHVWYNYCGIIIAPPLRQLALLRSVQNCQVPALANCASCTIVHNALCILSLIINALVQKLCI